LICISFRGFWKSDISFIFLFNSNFSSIMLKFRDIIPHSLHGAISGIYSLLVHTKPIVCALRFAFEFLILVWKWLLESWNTSMFNRICCLRLFMLWPLLWVYECLSIIFALIFIVKNFKLGSFSQTLNRILIFLITNKIGIFSELTQKFLPGLPAYFNFFF
jgi:hypothetical protein